MAFNIKITINNKMSSGNNPDKAFDIPLLTSTPILTSGTTLKDPDATIASRSSGSGGIYSGPTNTDVRGIVGYTLPGGESYLAIYFDTRKCRLGAFASSDTPTTTTVDKVATDNISEIKGSYVVGSDIYDYTATADDDAGCDYLKSTVTITASC